MGEEPLMVATSKSQAQPLHSQEAIFLTHHLRSKCIVAEGLLLGVATPAFDPSTLDAEAGVPLGV